MTRRTQADRLAATRNTLIAAAGDLLVEQGWAQATSVAVCARAGLTRGAFVHHFDGLPDLFAAVLAKSYDEIAAEVEPDRALRSIVEMVERTWAISRKPRYKIVLEAWLAGANDPDLGRRLDPVIETFAKLVAVDRWPELLVDDEATAFYLAARETILGLAWGRAVNRSEPLGHEDVVLNHLIETAKMHDARLGHKGEQP